MARVWSSGFELQTVGSGGVGVEWETTVGTVSISTSTVRSGAAALRCNPTAGTGYIQHSILAADDAAAHYYQRVYMRIASMPTARTNILSWSDGSGWIGVDLDTTGKLAINGDATLSATALTTGTWYRIELDFDDGANTVGVYLDGTLARSITGYDLGGGAKVRVGPQDTTTCDLYFDDYAVNDPSGSVQNGLPGAGKIVHLLPDSAGDNNGFATAVGGTAGAANNFTRVDEVPPDDATSYNNTTATGTTTIDDFNVTDSATAGIGASDTITLVQVGQRAGSSAVTTASIVTRLKGQASGTTTESASIPVNTTAWNTHRTTAPKIHQITAYTNPQTSTAWTSSSLDSMQIGYRGNVSQTTQRRITALWALVEYIPNTTANGTATVTGAGSISATGTVIVPGTATVTGAGSASATTTQQAGAAVTGVGVATATTTAAAGSTVSGAGSVTATSSQILRSTATVTGAGSTTAAVTHRPTATQSGTGSVTASTVLAAGATVAGVGAVTANAGGTVLGAASVAGTGSVSANPTQRAGSSATGSGSVSAAATLLGSATVAGQGSASASATQSVTSAVSGAGVVTANAAGTVTGTASVTGAGSVAAAATTRSSSTTTGSGTVSAVTTTRGTASVSGSGSTSASVRQLVTASVTGVGSVTASIATVVNGTATVQGAGLVVANVNARITPRPNAGTTARPGSGITLRPFAGTTARP